ncbi:TetR/AcrR family transcriptional regulator [Cupriavidus sp. BIS7]|uniref:TetR/AcrR family transcriptional regulator n=1 Tax=Cupriavidus sp. BIS7 TaxID=1217718 RepID=UPI0002FC2542|nr:TetR/AcrR family transcriptional regulator [Cupriavidus sp. BIS7]
MTAGEKAGEKVGETRAKATRYHHGDLQAAARVEAERILKTRGVAEVSLREVARGVGVSHAALYRHYANREALLVDLATRGFERLHARFDALPSRSAPARRFGALIEAYLAFAVEEPAVYRLMFGPELRKADHPEMAHAGYQALDVVRRMVAALGIEPPATAEVMSAWGLAHGLALLVLDRRLEFEPGVDEPIDHIVLARRACDIFLAGLQAQQPAPIPARRTTKG